MTSPWPSFLIYIIETGLTSLMGGFDEPARKAARTAWTQGQPWAWALSLVLGALHRQEGSWGGS